MTSPRLSAEQRRALHLLAINPHSITEELFVHCHGLSRRLLARLVRRGFAQKRLEMMMVADRAVAVVRLRITDAGRKAIEG
jgi:hypothetical protein